MEQPEKKLPKENLEKMISKLAHQWQQPLNCIALMVQDIEQTFEVGKLEKDYLSSTVENIMEQISLISTTIYDFRDFVSANPSHFQSHLPDPSSKEDKILVVDDVEESLDIMGRVITRMDLKPILVTTGKEALEVFDKYSDDIKLIIMDIQLDDMSGQEVVRKIRESGKARNINFMPIIAVSASTNEEREAICGENIFNDYLPKPIDLNQLQAVIKKHLK